ncbi:MAG: signal peptidase [Acidimicrobiaceae bacterium]
MRQLQEHGAGPAIADTAPVAAVHARRLALAGTVAVLAVVLDQLTKTWAVNALSDRDIDLFWTLRLHLVHNTGSSFSLAAGRGGLVALIAIPVVLVMLWVGRTVETTAGAVALGLVLGGAIGNLVDRLLRTGHGFLGGGVIDFIDPQWWPVFNVADIAISCGGVLLVLASARAPRPS